MKIDFYEEFPNKISLSKLKLIKFRTRIFLAAESLKEFQNLEKQAKNTNKNIECAYWPIIKNSYWISPFANTKDLKDSFNELNKSKNHLLIDLELPKNKTLILKNVLSYFKNRKIIKEFIENNKHRITTAQFPSSILSIFMKISGLDYDINVKKSFMYYSSMIPNKMQNNIRNNLVSLKNKSNYSISLGTIAKGILGTEPILQPKKLQEDLHFVKKAGFQQVIIFRLGGLNKEYVKIINKFL